MNIAHCDICGRGMEELLFEDEIIMCSECSKRDRLEIIKDLLKEIRQLENLANDLIADAEHYRKGWHIPDGYILKPE